jgi:hypothetical protein
MSVEVPSDDWSQSENWQRELESRIKMAMPIASTFEREHILYEAAYRRGRRSMRVPSLLVAISSCAATLLIAWCTMAFPNAATLHEPVMTEAKAPMKTHVAITPGPTSVPVIRLTEPLQTTERPTQQRLSVVSLRGESSRMPFDDWLRELDRSHEVQTDVAPVAEPGLRPRSNISFL